MSNQKSKKSARMRRSKKTRAKISELAVARLTVFRTPRHIYAQVIAPNGAQVLASASTLDKSMKQDFQGTGNITAASIIGRLIAERAMTAGVSKVAFDRSGFRFHGRVKALAEAAREAGLDF